MPGTHPKSMKPKRYSKDQVQLAMESIKSGMSYRKASQLFGVPRTTLSIKYRHPSLQKKHGPSRILTEKEELAVCNWIEDNVKMGFWKTQVEVCEAVKQVLDKAGRRVKLFKDNRPGKSWWWAFHRRHLELFTMQPAPVKHSKQKANNLRKKSESNKEEQFHDWLGRFERFLEKEGIRNADQIYYCFEYGFPLKAGSTKKICEGNILKRTFQKLTASTKTSVTTLQCICANGMIIPPAVFFPGKSLNQEYALGFPKSVYLRCCRSGWMEPNQFHDWISNHFVNWIPPSRPVLLLVDSHSSGIDLNTTKLCQENGICLYKLPGHSYSIQPLDKGFFEALLTEWKRSCSKFKMEYPGLEMTKRSFSNVFITALNRAARPSVIKSCFEISGIWPIRRQLALHVNQSTASTIIRSHVLNKNLGVSEVVMKESEASEPCITNQVDDHVAAIAIKDNREDEHQLISRAFAAIEEIIGQERKYLFESLIKENCEVKGDAIFEAWGLLKKALAKVKAGPSFSRTSSITETFISTDSSKTKNVLPSQPTKDAEIASINVLDKEEVLEQEE